MTRRAGRLATIGVVGLLALAPALPAAGDPHGTSGHADRTRHARVHDGREGWYASPPGCTLPTGCLPLSVNTAQYPKRTLHVGVQFGQESARSYIVPSLSHLPRHAVTVAGRLVLPVDTSSGAGTVGAATARIEACLVTGRVPKDAEGSTASPPATDCSVKAPATYQPKRNVFSVDLHPLLAAWRTGTAYRGIALIPVTKGDLPTTNWQVTFYGRQARHPVTLLVAYRIVHRPATATSPSPTPSPTASPPSREQSSGVPSAPAPTPVPLPGKVTAGKPVTPPQVAGQAPGAAPPAAGAAPVVLARNRFAYPTVFLLPVALLAGAVFFIRTFTANPLPIRRGAR